MKHQVDAPLCGKFESIIDSGHHLNNGKGAVSSGRKLCGWLVGVQVASF